MDVKNILLVTLVLVTVSLQGMEYTTSSENSIHEKEIFFDLLHNNIEINNVPLVEMTISLFPHLQDCVNEKDGLTPLAFAASKEKDSIVSFLITKGADPELAVELLKNRSHFYATIVKHNPNKDNEKLIANFNNAQTIINNTIMRYSQLLISSIKANIPTLARDIVTLIPAIKKSNPPPLVLAAFLGRKKITEELIKLGADTKTALQQLDNDYRNHIAGNRAIINSAEESNQFINANTCIRSIINKHSGFEEGNPVYTQQPTDIVDQEPIYEEYCHELSIFLALTASQPYDDPIIKVLIQNGVSTDNALAYLGRLYREKILEEDAIVEAERRIVQAKINHIIPVFNHIIEEGSTEQIASTIESLQSNIRFFINSKLDNKTPLYRAAYRGNDAVVRLLIDHGADVQQALRLLQIQSNNEMKIWHKNEQNGVKFLYLEDVYKNAETCIIKAAQNKFINGTRAREEEKIIKSLHDFESKNDFEKSNSKKECIIEWRLTNDIPYEELLELYNFYDDPESIPTTEQPQ